MNIDQSLVNSVITFEAYSGEQFKNRKLLSILDSGTVLALGFDAAAAHHQNFPYMPQGTSDDFQSYMYAKFIDSSQTVTFLGVPWIKPSSVVVNDNPDYQIVIKNPTPQQLNSVRSMLTASGIEDFEIKIL